MTNDVGKCPELFRWLAIEQQMKLYFRVIAKYARAGFPGKPTDTVELPRN